MYIVDQDRSNVVNIGNVKSIALSGKRITADDYTLAAYDTEQRGKEVCSPHWPGHPGQCFSS